MIYSVAGWETYILHDLEHASWVRYVQHLETAGRDLNNLDDLSLDDLSLDDLSLDDLSLDGLSLDDLSLDDLSLDDLSLDGPSLDYMSLDDLSLDGISLEGLSLDYLSLDYLSLDDLSLDCLSVDHLCVRRVEGLQQRACTFASCCRSRCNDHVGEKESSTAPQHYYQNRVGVETFLGHRDCDYTHDAWSVRSKQLHTYRVTLPHAW